MDKSFVALAQAACPVCATVFDTGELILDTRLRERFNSHEVTGWRMCPEHQKLRDDGYTALVGVDEAKSRQPMNLENAYRTGSVAHVRNEVWPQIFNAPLPPQGMAFVPPEVLDMLAKIQAGAE